MKATPVARTSIKVGDRIVLGVVKSAELSPSGKTIKITVAKWSGNDFTDRISSAGNMYILTD